VTVAITILLIYYIGRVILSCGDWGFTLFTVLFSMPCEFGKINTLHGLLNYCGLISCSALLFLPVMYLLIEICTLL